MPILTDEELDSLHQQIASKDDSLDKQNETIAELKESKAEHAQQKKTFLVLFIIALVLLIVFIGLSYSNPSLLSITPKAENSEDNQLVLTVDSLKQEVNRLEVANTSLEQDLSERNSSVELEEPSEYYAVQIGAFERFKTPLVSKDFLLIRGDENYYLNSYSIGVFKTLEEAQQLQEALIELGFKEAFTAKYKNAKRIDIIE